MPPVAASQQTTEPTPQHPENVMNEEQLKALRASLGLAADADVSTILAAASKAKALPASVPSEVITAAVKPVQEQLAASDKRVAKLEADLLERDVDTAIEAGKRGDGKQGRAITPELRGFIVATAKTGGLDEAKKLIAALPLTVPMTAIGHETKQEDGKVSAAAAQKELDELVAAKMKGGLSFKDATRAAGKERKDLADAAFTVPTTHAATAEN